MDGLVVSLLLTSGLVVAVVAAVAVVSDVIAVELL